MAALVVLSAGFALAFHRSNGAALEVCIVDAGGAGGGCSAGAVIVYRVEEEGVFEALPGVGEGSSALLVPYQFAVEHGLAPGCGCRLLEPAPGYVLVYRGFSVLLGDAGEDAVAGVVRLLDGGAEGLGGFDLLYGFRAGGRVYLLGARCRGVDVGGGGSSKLSASVPVRSLDHLWIMRLGLAGASGFEAGVSVRVLEGFLSGYAPSTARAPVALRLADGSVLEAGFRGWYIDRSDFGAELAAWRVRVEDGGGVVVVPFHVEVAGDRVVVMVEASVEGGGLRLVLGCGG